MISLLSAIHAHSGGLRVGGSREFKMREPVIPVGTHFQRRAGKGYEIVISGDGLSGKITRIS
jgi:hypothetical protein